MAKDEKTLTEQFQFLNELRSSGKTNMFGAAPFLERKFGLGKGDAKDILLDWMEYFSEERTPNEMAKIILAKKEKQ